MQGVDIDHIHIPLSNETENFFCFMQVSKAKYRYINLGSVMSLYSSESCHSLNMHFVLITFKQVI